jgi:hypothetical protein
VAIGTLPKKASPGYPYTWQVVPEWLVRMRVIPRCPPEAAFKPVKAIDSCVV